MTTRHVIILSSLALILVLAFPNGVHADLKCPAGVDSTDVEKTWIGLQLGIPGVTVTCTDTTTGVTRDYVKDMGAYIGGLYRYFVGVIGIIATLMVFYGGLRWLTAAGNAGHVKEAKEIIFAALIAILIAFGSYTLLYTINPKLVVINPPVLKLADTFLVNFSNTCPVTKVCLSGTSIGNTCITDAGCPGAGSGACDSPIVLPADHKCGDQLDYKKVPGLKLTSETCIDTYCPGGQVCTNIGNARLAPTKDKGKCMTPQEQCAVINSSGGSSLLGADLPTNADCARADVPGVGACRIGEGLKFCVWLPLLVCPSGYIRAGCDECSGAGKTCAQYNSKDSVCSVAPTLYSGDYDNKTSTYPAVCCKQAGPPIDLQCLSS